MSTQTSAAPFPGGLRSPYPWAGGKSTVASLIWSRLGDVPVFVDPFFGSNAVLLSRPHPPRLETINDKDGFVTNVWRSIQHDPDAVARYADQPVNECDLHARHAWLVGERRDLTERLMGDMDYYDPRIAGLWLWGICCWIGAGWCSGRGPWQAVDGRLVKVATARAAGAGLERKRPHLMHEGKGVHRQVAHLGNHGRGVHVQIPHLGGAGRGVATPGISNLQMWMSALADRLRRVRVCCGEWDRVLGPAGTVHLGTTGVLLDPPYRYEDREKELYAVDMDVWEKVRIWAAEHGADRRLRIVLCGYSDAPETVMPTGWTWHRWQASGGYGNQGHGRGRANAARECIWFSPHCLASVQPSLFEVS